jgi:hypothetical protein
MKEWILMIGKFGLAVSGVLWLMVSCSKDAEIQYQVKITIDAFDIVKDLKWPDNYERLYVFPNGEIDRSDMQARVKLFVYDNGGALISEDEELIANYMETVTITKTLMSGEYTFVSSADMILIKENGPPFEMWEFENKSTLNDFRINDKNTKSYHYKTLGVHQMTMRIDKVENITMNMEPAGALVYFAFSGDTYKSLDSIKYTWSKGNEYYKVKEGYSVPMIATFYDMTEVDSQDKGVYDIIYFLPAEGVTFTWEAYQASLKSQGGSITFDIRQKDNFMIYSDVTTGETIKKAIIATDQ